MKITAEKINSFAMDYLIVFFLFSGFVEFRAVWHIGILILFVILILVNSSFKEVNLIVMVLISLILVLFMLSAVISRSNEYIVNNFRSSLYSLCTLGICLIVTKANGNLIVEKLKNKIRSFNFLLLINIVILAIQSMRTGFLIRVVWLAENPYYEDHCAGIFGKNSTNILALYSIFVMLLNLYFARTEIMKQTEKKVFVIYTIIVQGVMAILSQFNDNIGFYFMLGIFAICYVASLNLQDRDIRKKITQFWGYIIIIFFVSLVLFNIPSLNEYINSVVSDRIYRLFNYNRISGGASGSSERLAIIEYAISQPSTFLLGKGVGSTMWIQANRFGFAHFGINSIGSYMLMGGVWFFLTYVMFYAYAYYRMIINGVGKSYKLVVAVFGLVIFFTIYTTLFNDARTVFGLGIIVSLIKMLFPTVKRATY